tara:strand:- start:599 stop:3328 length:2730 start_codon:yes stop_codon:yes gene_type:complete
MSPGEVAVANLHRRAPGGLARGPPSAATEPRISLCVALALGMIAAMATGVDATGCPADSLAVPDPGITPAVTAVAVSGVANENYLAFPASSTPYTVVIDSTVATQGDILLISGTRFLYTQNVAIVGDHTVDVSADATSLTGSRGPYISSEDGEVWRDSSPDNTGLMVHYTFDHVYGTNQIKDEVGSNHLDFASSATDIIDSTDGIFGGSVLLNEGSDTLSSSQTFPVINQATTRTISVWVKRHQTGTNDFIVQQGDSDPKLVLRYKNNNFLQLTIWGTFGINSAVAYTNTNEWIYITAIINGQSLILYVNSVESNSASSSSSFHIAESNIRVGSTSSTSNILNIDDLRIYDRVLSGTEIQTMYLQSTFRVQNAITGTLTDYKSPQAILRYHVCGHTSGCPEDSLEVPHPVINSLVSAVAVPGVPNENYLVFPASPTSYTVSIDSTVATQGDVLLISGTQFLYAQNVAILGDYTVDVRADATSLTGSRAPGMSTVDGNALAGGSLSTTNDIGGLVAHWRFDESSAGQLTDSVGANHFSYPSSAYGSVVSMDSTNKIFTGSVDIDTSGVDFHDASGARITTSTNTFITDDTTQRTYSFWVKRNRVCGNCGSCDCKDWIFTQPANFVHDSANPSKGTLFFLKFAYNQMQFYHYFSGGFWAKNIDGSVATFTSTETWLHIALIFNQRTISLYLNGVFNNEHTSWTETWNVAGTLELGRGYNLYNNQQYSTKLNIDDFRIYNRALTGEEINGIYSEGQGIFAHAITGTMTEYNTPHAIIRYDVCGYPPPVVKIDVTQNVTFLLAKGNVSYTGINAAIEDSIREALAGNLTGGDTARVHVVHVKDSPRRPGKEANMVLLVGGDDSDTPDGHAFLRQKADWVGGVVRQELEQNSFVVCGCNAASFMDGDIQVSVQC